MSEVYNNNVLSYPTMTRQRSEKIMSKEVAYAEDVNAEFDHIVDTYNRLVLMLTGEWGDGTGRIYDLVDNAVSLANSAIAKANDCVQKSGDTMTGQLNIALVPASDYNVVNKKYVDDTIDAELSDPLNRIQQLEDWKENLNATQVKLENENFSSNNVNDGMNELFISVSSGKATVAAAITGKGIETASDASFKQMADNINAILTFQEGTAGGTATAEDVMYGKTAYARGGLIVGKYVPLDLSDATATSDKIIMGYTAYVGGGKIIGTYNPPRDYPVYGTDTSNATATADDIVYGKTAYARGQLITGTLKNTDVEEIYGINDDISVNTNPAKFTKDPLTNEQIGVVDYTLSENCDYIVRVESINNVKYIASYPINDKGLYILQSTGMNGEVTTKKYRYTKTELGIPDAEDIVAIKLAPGTSGTTLLYIPTREIISTEPSTTYNHYLYIFTYHLRENGVIGKEYENEKGIVNIKEKIDITYSKVSTLHIFPKHTNPKEFFIGYSSESGFGVRYGYLRLYEILINADYTTQTVSMKHEYTNLSDNRFSISFARRELSKNDKFLYHTSYLYNDSYNVIYIDNVTNKIYGTSLSTYHICYDYINDKFYTTSTNGTEHSLKQYQISFNGNSLATVEEKTFLIDLSNLENVSSKISFNHAPITVSNSYILAFPYLSTGNSLYCLYFNTNINNVSDGETIKSFSKNILSATYDYESTNVKVSASGNRVLVNDMNDMINLGIDYENIIGVKYKNKTFYAVGENTGLTAAVADVKSGKTFIGQNGIAETGTMEV